MKNFFHLKDQLQSKSIRLLLWFITVVSFLGIVDAGYLTASYFLSSTPTCAILKACDVVTTSSYATIGPVPIALVGLLGYLAIFIFSIFYLEKRFSFLRKFIFTVASFGFLASLLLFSIQAFVLNAFCLYCVFSGVFMALVFILSLVLNTRINSLKNN